MKSDRLESLLAEFPRLTIGLVGDLVLDRYLEIEPGTHELSIETGLEAYQVTRVRNAPGALGTVMNNLVALGVGQLIPVTVIGDDGHGDDLLRELQTMPLDVNRVIRDSARLTPTYTKPLKQDGAGDWQELHRLDVKARGPLSDETTASVCEHVRQAFGESDGLIVLDQFVEEDWGVVNRQVRETLAELARESPDKLILSDSRAHIGRFHFGTLKGNCRELAAARGNNDADITVVRRAMIEMSRANGQPVFCTFGKLGIAYAQPDESYTHVAGFPAPEPVDIVGAGDAATAGLVASLLAGADETEAATIANLVASITVQQLGTTGTASREQVIQRWHEIH